MTARSPLRRRLLLVAACGCPFLAASLLAGLTFGPSGWSLPDFLRALSGAGDQVPLAVLRELCLPRVIVAAHAGATLAVGGLAFQAVLRNPLAEPYPQGVFGGAAVGTILALLLGLSPFPTA